VVPAEVLPAVRDLFDRCFRVVQGLGHGGTGTGRHAGAHASIRLPSFAGSSRAARARCPTCLDERVREFEIHYFDSWPICLTPARPRLPELAALEHAHLAVCLDLRANPQTGCAEVVRRDLLAARDAPSRRELPESEYALAMPLMRTHGQPCGPSVALGCVHRPEGLAEWWSALAGTIAVPWLLADAPPASGRLSDPRPG
jgi:hypothetical protein